MVLSMIIFINKFGSVLTSRESGKEAYAAFQPTLATLDPSDGITVDFSGVGTLSPGWADEFLTPLHVTYGPLLILHRTSNLSVSLTIETLEQANGISFRWENI